MMTQIYDELLKFYARTLLCKDTGIDSMLARTDSPDAAVAREGTLIENDSYL